MPMIWKRNAASRRTGCCSSKVVKGLGPSVYRADASLVSGSDPEELETLKNNFLIRKLGLPDGPDLVSGIEQVVEPYIRGKAIRYLEEGKVVIFAAGTGNPFFTTDTAAALRAAEIDADALLKGTHSGVDGVYDADPRLVPTATKYDEVSYIEVMTKDLKVMDATAIAFCRDHKIPIVVFDMSSPGALQAILRGASVGTIVRDRPA